MIPNNFSPRIPPLDHPVIKTPGTTKTTLEHISLGVFPRICSDLGTARAMGLTSRHFYNQIFSNGFPWRSLLMGLFPNFHDEVPTDMENLDFYRYFTQIGVNLRDGKCQEVMLEGHQGLVNAMIIEGDLLITGSEDRTIRIWKIKTGELLLTIAQGEPVTALAIRERSDGSKMIISGSKGCKVKFWNMANGESLGGFEHNCGSRTDEINTLWMRNSKLFTTCSNGATGICEFAKPLKTRTFASYKDLATSVCIDENDFILSFGFESRDYRGYLIEKSRIVIYDLLEQKPNRFFKTVDEIFTFLKVHENSVFAATKHGEIYIWDLEKGTLCGKMRMPGRRNILSMLTHSNQLIVALENLSKNRSEIKIWNLPISVPMLEQALPDHRSVAIDEVVHNLFICRGDKLVSASWGSNAFQRLKGLKDPTIVSKTIHIWDIKSGNLLWTFKEENQKCMEDIHYPTLVDQGKIFSALPNGSIRVLNFSPSN